MAIQVVQTSVNRLNSGADTTLTLTGVTPGSVIIAYSLGGMPRLYDGYKRFNSVYAYKIARSSTESYTFYDLADGFYAPVYLMEVSGIDLIRPIYSNLYTYDAKSATSVSMSDWLTSDVLVGAVAIFNPTNYTAATIPAAGTTSPTYALKGSYTYSQAANAVRYEVFYNELTNPGTYDLTYTTTGSGGITGDMIFLRAAMTSQEQTGNTRIVVPDRAAPSSGMSGGYGTFGFGGIFGGEVQTTGEVTVDRDQVGTARITAIVNKTTIGTARITAPTPKVQLGTARITARPTRTQLGNARITATVDKTVSGNANITTVNDKPQTGNANIESLIITTDQPQTGMANIRSDTVRDQLGDARITTQPTKAQVGTARITTVVAQNQLGTARIRKTIDASLTGNARIQQTVDTTISGNARINHLYEQTITGNASIATTSTKPITGIAKIVAQASRDQAGAAFIINPLVAAPGLYIPTYDTNGSFGEATVSEGNYVAGHSGHGSIETLTIEEGGIYVPTTGTTGRY